MLVPVGFKAVSIEENPHAIATRKVYIYNTHLYNTIHICYIKVLVEFT